MAELASVRLVARPPCPWSVRATRECSTPSGREKITVTGTPDALPVRSRASAVRCTASPPR